MFGMDLRTSWGLCLAGSLAAGCLTLAVAGPAGAADGSVFPPNYRFPNGDHGFFLEAPEFIDVTGHLLDPCLFVGFNPMPGPGALPVTMIDLTDPLNPVLGNPATGPFTLQFALLGVGNGRIPLPAAPNSDGMTGFRQLIDGHTLDVHFAFADGSVMPASWAAFNPLPEPPGDFLGVAMTFPGDPSFSFNVTLDGHPLIFSLGPTPEPATWALMLVGFGLVGAALRRRAAFGPA